MVKRFTFKALAATAILALGSAGSASAAWYMSGTFNDYQDAQMEAKGNGVFTIEVEKLTNGFFFHDDVWNDFGGSEPIVPGEECNVNAGGNDLSFVDGVSYVENAFVTLDTNNGKLLVTGTPHRESASSLKVYIVGDFNNYAYAPEYELINEPGTKIYSTQLDFFNGTETTEWMIEVADGDVKHRWGLDEKASAPTLSGYLFEDGLNPAIAYGMNYTVSFNLATGAYSLTEALNFDKKTIVSSPAADGTELKYNQFILTFNGYNTVTLDPAMYDVMNGPGTFTNVASGEVVARVGGQPTPYINNEAIIQLSQTIFGQAYLDTVEIEPGDEQSYVPYPAGVYEMKIPAGMLTLNDGNVPVPNSEITLLFNLAGIQSGIQTLAPEYEGMDVYGLDGVLKVRGAKASDINSLPRGIYVVKGRKIAVK